MTRAMALDGNIRTRFGRVDIVRWCDLHKIGVHLHVFLDGEDVTCKTRVADDEEHWIDMYKLNPMGRKYIEAGKDATEMVMGDIEIVELPHEGPCEALAGKRRS